MRQLFNLFDRGPKLSLDIRLALWKFLHFESASQHAFSIRFGLQTVREHVAASFGLDISWRSLIIPATGWLFWIAISAQRRARLKSKFCTRTTVRVSKVDGKHYAKLLIANRGTPYQYQPLDPVKAEIRLLHILPGSGKDEVCISVTHASLSSNVKYVALSYTWGLYSPRTKIVVDGYDFDVACNLGTALSHLRRDRGDYFGVPYWIDAISINQDDHQERSEQVKLMTRIYEQASSVTIWLGVPSAATEVAFAVMRSLEARVSTARKFTNSENSPKTPTDPSPEEWEAIIPVLAHPYFTRVWIAQEITNPFRQNVEFVGGREMQRFSLHNTVRIAITMASIYAQGGVERSAAITSIRAVLNASQALDRIIGLGHVRYRLNVVYLRRLNYLKRWFSSSMDLHKVLWRDEMPALLDRYRPLQSTDPRDKVFAALAIMKPLESLIDYSLNVVDVYKMVVHEAVKHTQSLDILAYCTERGRGIPSWVPDWRYSGSSHRLCSFHNLHGECIYHSSGGAQAVVTFEGNTMLLQGVIVDTVKWCGELSDQHEPPFPVEWAKETAYENERPLEVYNQLICADCEIHLSRDVFKSSWKNKALDIGYSLIDSFLGTGWQDESLSTDLGRLVGHLDHGFRTGRIAEVCKRVGPRSINQHVRPAMEQPTNTSLIDQDSPNEKSTREKVLIGRKLCTTLKQKFLGLVPTGALDGDAIAVLYGAHTPFVLRPRHSLPKQARFRFELIGESYIHGLMDGEALQMIETGTYNMQQICIE